VGSAVTIAHLSPHAYQTRHSPRAGASRSSSSCAAPTAVTGTGFPAVSALAAGARALTSTAAAAMSRRTEVASITVPTGSPIRRAEHTCASTEASNPPTPTSTPLAKGQDVYLARESRTFSSGLAPSDTS
jgi:hypothetical protein